MWRNKGGIIVLIIILTMVSSCASTRKRGQGKERNLAVISDLNAFGEAVKSLNINGEGFIIRKADVEMEGTAVEGKVSLYGKINNKGDFLVSVRGPLGIELARAISAGDSVFLINKINRVVLCGSRSSLMKRYGLPENLIEIITGDMPETVSFSEAVISENGLVSLSYSDVKYRNEVSVNSEMKKISQDIISTSAGETKYLMKFGNYIDSGSKRYPSLIEIEGVEQMFHVKIDIMDLKLGFNENIDVVLPPYRRESL